MFLKSLTISSHDEIIRTINFHNGINLIVDETPNIKDTATGNNVGKTTVLMLVDFCLGGDAKQIYTEPEHKKDEYKLVKDYLVENQVVITLVLKEDLSVDDSPEVRIERNFLPRKRKLQKINGVAKTEDEFEDALTDILFPDHRGKPTFRQIISHNIRYKDLSLTNTLKTLDRYTSDAEYETLHLYFEADLDRLNQVKYQINLASSEIGRLNIRRDLINEAKRDLEASAAQIDLRQLEQIYRQTTDRLAGIQKTFVDLCSFHNRMIEEKVRYIAKDLPRLEVGIKAKSEHLSRLLLQEAELTAAISRSESFAELEKLIAKLKEKNT